MNNNNNNKFTCQVCGMDFNRRDNLNRHLKSHQPAMNIMCDICGLQFSRSDNLNRHVRTRHQQPQQQCNQSPVVSQQQQDAGVQITENISTTPDILNVIEENTIAQQQSQIIDLNTQQQSSLDTQVVSNCASSYGISQSLLTSIPNTQELIEAIDLDIFSSQLEEQPQQQQQPAIPFRSVDLDLTPSDAPTQYEIHDISTGELNELPISGHEIIQPVMLVSPSSVEENASSPHYSASMSSLFYQNAQQFDSPLSVIENQASSSTSTFARRCAWFPSYCAAGIPHSYDRCIPAMKKYFGTGNNCFACPSCNLCVNSWSLFMQSHAIHAGQFKNGQKKQLTSNCPWFPLYCMSSRGDHNEERCTIKMKMYYNVGFQHYGCPTCNLSCGTWSEFVEEHSHHAGQFREGQKSELKPRGCPTFASHCRASGHENRDYCIRITLPYYRVPSGYLCPRCDTIIDNANDFVSAHSTHLTEFNGQQLQQRHAINRSTVIHQRSDMVNTGNQTGGGASNNQPTTSSSNTDNQPGSSRGIGRASSSFNRNVQCFDFDVTYPENSITRYVNVNKQNIKASIITNSTKIQFMAQCRFSKNSNGTVVEKDWFFSNKAVPYYNNFLEDGAEKLQEKIANYASGSSGWICEQILKLTFCCIAYNRLNRLSGHSYLPTPSKIYAKKCCVNVNNTDEMCFLYAILAVWKYDEIPSNRNHVYQYEKYLPLLKYRPENMPMKIKDVSLFEKMNPQFRINILTYNENMDNATMRNDNEEDKGEVYSNAAFDLIYRSKNMNENAFPINLLLIEKYNKYHYIGIVNLSKLLNIHKGTSVRIQGKWCEHCIRCFRKMETYNKHLQLCKSNKLKNVLYTMPENKELRFSDWSKTISPAYIAYADFESLLELNGEDGQLHKPLAAGVLIVPGIQHQHTFEPEYREFFGPDCVGEFLTHLERWGKRIKQWYKRYGNEEMTLSEAEEDEFHASTRCYLCGCEFEDEETKNRDHDHFTGEYIGAACSKCNLARRIRKPFLPIFFHNFKGYDLHHIMKYGVSSFSHWGMTCIPQSTEKFMALCCNIKESVQLRFLDSLQFLNSSLGTLASLLPGEKQVYTNTLTYPDYVKRRKGVFPYSYITALDKVYDGLPPLESFNDKIQTIDEEDYVHAENTYRDCQCSNLKDYLMLYLRIDVHLLADVFQTFRETALNEDGLEPCKYFSIPGLSWDSALKSMANTDLQLLQDSTVYEFFEAGVRGGMTFVNKHFVDENNGEILYIDINNLYGYALSQKLPCGDFVMISDDNMLADILNNLPAEDSDVGYYLEVDLHIPPELHKKFEELPPAPIKQCPPNNKTEKLLLTLENKQNYKIHYSLLKFYMHLGVQVTRIHRACRFKQDYIFAQYIAHNTARRAAANNKFQKDFYKLKNNSLFGKTVENLRKRINIRIINSDRKLITYSSKATFKRLFLIDEDLAIATMGKESICLNRPVFIGQAILDISKLRMYRLQYVELEKYRNMFNCQIEIIAGDTDSFFLQCRNVSVRSQLLPAMLIDELLDSSNFDPNDPLYSDRFTNAIGKFKDETGCKFRIQEAVFLRPKCYSLKTSENIDIKKAKGVTYRTVKESLSHADYLHIYYAYDPQNEYANDDDDDDIPMKRICIDQTTIRSKHHQLYTITSKKAALSCMDDKRKWLDCNKSLPYGHCDINSTVDLQFT